MRAVAIVLSCVLASAAFARPASPAVVIYRCTDAAGAVTLQNGHACPKGARQARLVIDAPAPAPAYRPPVAAPAPPPATMPAVAVDTPSPPAIADKDRLPPPALYQCNTFDNDSYLSEQATPAPRCVRLQTTDLEGAADNAGVACQMVTDQCQRIPDGAACDSWKQRLRETEAAWKFARADEADANKVEFERVQAIVRDSTCGK